MQRAEAALLCSVTQHFKLVTGCSWLLQAAEHTFTPLSPGSGYEVWLLTCSRVCVVQTSKFMISVISCSDFTAYIKRKYIHNRKPNYSLVNETTT
jgi:hypothetical protein